MRIVGTAIGPAIAGMYMQTNQSIIEMLAGVGAVAAVASAVAAGTAGSTKQLTFFIFIFISVSLLN